MRCGREVVDDFLIIVAALLKVAFQERAPGNGAPRAMLLGVEIVHFVVILERFVELRFLEVVMTKTQASGYAFGL